MLLWAVVLFAQSSIPQDSLPPMPPIIGWDKLVHMVLYGVLAYLAMRSRIEGHPMVWIIILFCLAYGASDELHQLAVPGRTASIYDWIADSLGAILVVSVVSWRQKRRLSQVLP